MRCTYSRVNDVYVHPRSSELGIVIIVQRKGRLIDPIEAANKDEYEEHSNKESIEAYFR